MKTNKNNVTEMTIEQAKQVLRDAGYFVDNKSTNHITIEKRLEIISENISAFSDYMDETRQMSNIPDEAWNYIVEIEKAVGGIWKYDDK